MIRDLLRCMLNEITYMFYKITTTVINAVLLAVKLA